MELTRIAKRGPDKILSTGHRLSASFDPNSHRIESARIWFHEGDSVSRYRVGMSREEAKHLRDTLTDWLGRANP
jgi:hypothetical protein